MTKDEALQKIEELETLIKECDVKISNYICGFNEDHNED